ncbi:MAG TPA: hypothetical protein VLB01_03565 [Thermodesulfobacteriota bacterium]|nr:hypothetical protein [Thermodesulfobacteriota bacterium]
MKRNSSCLFFLFLSALVLGLLVMPNSVWAGSKIFDSQNNCTSLNCQSLTFMGSYETNENDNVDPFLIQVFSTGSECLRIDVTGQGTDLEATLVSPSGKIWQNDDRSGSNPRPLIKAITDVRGWYPLILSHSTGAFNNADFTVKVGRYPSSNVNCDNPTSPSLEAETSLESSKPLDGGASGNQPAEGPNTRP